MHSHARPTFHQQRTGPYRLPFPPNWSFYLHYCRISFWYSPLKTVLHWQDYCDQWPLPLLIGVEFEYGVSIPVAVVMMPMRLNSMSAQHQTLAARIGNLLISSFLIYVALIKFIFKKRGSYYRKSYFNSATSNTVNIYLHAIAKRC